MQLVDEMKQLKKGMAIWVQEQDAKTAEAKRVAAQAAQAAQAKQAAQVDRAERAAEQAAEQAARMKRAEAQLREATAEAKQAAEAAKAAELAAKAAVEAREAARASAAAQAATAVSASTHAWADRPWSGARGKAWWGEVGGDEAWDQQWAAGRSAASSQTWVPVPSELLKVWLKNHGLRTVYDKDAYGWTALHHAALESVDHKEGATIFKELMRFSWQATCGFIHSQFVSSCPDSRGSRSELIWVCSLIGFQPDRPYQCQASIRLRARLLTYRAMGGPTVTGRSVGLLDARRAGAQADRAVGLAHVG